MNFETGFEDTLPGRRVARLVLAGLRRVTVVCVLLLLPVFAAGQVSKRLSIEFPEPAGAGSAA